MSKVVCDIQMVGETKTIKMIWTISQFNSHFKEPSRESETRRRREIRPEQYTIRSGSGDSLFKLKMLILGHNCDIIEIYYSSSTPVIISTEMRKSQVGTFNKAYHTVQMNKWIYMATLPKDNICDYKEISFYFEFVVPYTLNVYNNGIQICNDYENFFKNDTFSDVIMKSKEGTEYKVHKVILASRSSVLKAHFEHNTVECQTNVIESPLESDVLNEVLTYMYSGKLPRITEFSDKLLPAADYYQLSDLKTLCEEDLHKNLTEDNAIEVLLQAELYSDRLKELTLEFIKNCQIQLITNSKGWENLQSVELMKTIFEYVLVDDEKTN